MTWALEDWTVDALELSDELKDFAREMAGESAVALTSDRENILLTAALEVELYIGKMIFRGVGGAPRVATSVIEIEAPFTAPAVGALPKSTGVTVTAVERWDDAVEAFAPSTYIRRPLGRILVPAGGTFRIAASVLPTATYPTVIAEATARLFSYREAFKPREKLQRTVGWERAVYHGHDDEERCSRIAPLRSYAGGVMAGRIGATIYGTAAWKRLRLEALQAANWRCSRCHRYGNECHHRHPLTSGGPELPGLSGLEILCRRCHFENHQPSARRAWDALLDRLRGG